MKEGLLQLWWCGGSVGGGLLRRWGVCHQGGLTVRWWVGGWGFEVTHLRSVGGVWGGLVDGWMFVGVGLRGLGAQLVVVVYILDIHFHSEQEVFSRSVPMF